MAAVPPLAALMAQFILLFANEISPADGGIMVSLTFVVVTTILTGAVAGAAVHSLVAGALHGASK